MREENNDRERDTTNGVLYKWHCHRNRSVNSTHAAALVPDNRRRAKTAVGKRRSVADDDVTDDSNAGRVPSVRRRECGTSERE